MDVMVRDVVNNDRDRWCRGKVIGTVTGKDDEPERIWVEYKRRGEYFYVSCTKTEGIVMPLDDDVLTIISFGEKALGFLEDFRN